MEYIYSKEPKWYVLHTFSGYENVAKENLETVVKKFNLEDRIFDIVIPEEDVIEEKNGKKKLVTRKSMPCYLLVKMIYGDDLWHNITNTRGITGFVGPKGRPLALTEDEVMKMRLEKIKVETDLEVGDKVEIIEGPLDKMVGSIVSVNADAGLVTVTVEMFGRENNVELSFEQVHKIN
ncbi:MAG: transcription termination/antitermination protein NusG [Candidatus Caccovivens sp.]